MHEETTTNNFDESLKNRPPFFLQTYTPDGCQTLFKVPESHFWCFELVFWQFLFSSSHSYSLLSHRENKHQKNIFWNLSTTLTRTSFLFLSITERLSMKLMMCLALMIQKFYIFQSLQYAVTAHRYSKNVYPIWWLINRNVSHAPINVREKTQEQR